MSRLLGALALAGMILGGGWETPRQAYDRLSESFRDASAAFTARRSAAASDDERQALWREIQTTVRETATRMRDLALASPDDPSVVFDAWRWLADWVQPGDLRTEALTVLARDHARNTRLAELFPTIDLDQWHDEDDLLRAIAEKNNSRDVRAVAAYLLARSLREQVRIARRLATEPALHHEGEPTIDEVTRERLRGKSPEQVSEEAATWFERVARDFGDVRYDDQPLADAARAELFEVRHLNVGQPAPEIEGRDADGTTFRLSDYRGRVVVLTFSGNWCVPCRAMYPEERRLVELGRECPVTVLSVNTDQDVATLKASIADGTITWRCWWDGPPGGPIARAWNVQIYPAVYVLDQEGVIRFKKVGRHEYAGERIDLDAAVNGLLGEVER
jgi:peroxiredoxin